MVNAPDARDLAVQLITGSARLVRLAARESPSNVPRALARSLAVVSELGEPRISDIASADRISQPTATTIVQKLEERGWVERAPDAADARAVRIRITASGRAALEGFRQLAADALAPRLARLTAAELSALSAGATVLSRLLEHQHPVEDNA